MARAEANQIIEDARATANKVQEELRQIAQAAAKGRGSFWVQRQAVRAAPAR